MSGGWERAYLHTAEAFVCVVGPGIDHAGDEE